MACCIMLYIVQLIKIISDQYQKAGNWNQYRREKTGIRTFPMK